MTEFDKWVNIQNHFDDKRKQPNFTFLQLGDIKANLTTDFLNPRMETVTGTLTIPDDYFGDFATAEEMPDAIRYCIGRGFWSTRSKVAQAGLNLEPLFPTNHLPSDIPVTHVKDKGFVAPFKIRNLTPDYRYKIPSGEFALTRFFVTPFEPLSGEQLTQAVDQLGNQDISVVDNTLIVPLVRYGYYRGGERTLDLEKLLQIPHKQRAELDKFLHLEFTNIQEMNQSPLGWEAAIGETGPVHLPGDTVGIISTPYGVEDEGTRALLPYYSPVVDPHFQDRIRSEDWVLGYNAPRPTNLHMQLFSA